MKKLIYAILIVVFAAGSFNATAQTERTVGGFGHFFIGPSLLQSKKINDYLKKDDVLGSAYSPSSFGYTIGGEGAAILNKFIIGGGGFGIVSPSSSSDSARALPALGGGYFKIGYIFHQTHSSFCYGYASFGGSGYSVTISNIADSKPVNFNHKYPLAAGKKETYSFGGFMFDFGISIKTFAIGGSSGTSGKRGGFMLGVDLGCNLSMPISDWEASSHNNNNTSGDNKIVVTGAPNPPALLSPYLRITIGGGGLITKKY